MVGNYRKSKVSQQALYFDLRQTLYTKKLKIKELLLFFHSYINIKLASVLQQSQNVVFSEYRIGLGKFLSF